MQPNPVFWHPYRREFSKRAKEAISTDDTRLIHALAREDPEALARIMDRYANYVATVIQNQLGAFALREDTEELTANVFVSLWQHQIGRAHV